MPDLCNIFKSIKYVYTSSKVVAILPYHIETTNCEIKVTPDLYSYFFTILTSIAIFGHGLTFPFYVFSLEAHCIFCFTDDNSTTEYLSHHGYQTIAVKILSRFLISMMSFSAIFFALLYSSKLPDFLYKMHDTDFYFRALLRHSQTGVECCISKNITTGLLLINLPALGYYTYADTSKPDTSLLSVVFLLIMMWDNINAAVCDSQFMNFTYLLRVRFRIINNYLTGLRKADMGRLIRMRECVEARWSVDHAPPDEPRSEAALSLELCRRCHGHLCDLTRDLGSLYQMVCLTSLSGCFVKVLFIVFDLVVGSTRRYSSGTYEEILKRIFWINFYASRFFLLILFACKTAQEGIHTKTLIAELLSSTHDTNIKKELVLFYNQVKTRSIDFTPCSLFTLSPELITSIAFGNSLELSRSAAYGVFNDLFIDFTPCSLFTLSPELITSAIGVGTTYLVILIQFHEPT